MNALSGDRLAGAGSYSSERVPLCGSIRGSLFAELILGNVWTTGCRTNTGGGRGHLAWVSSLAELPSLGMVMSHGHEETGRNKGT